MRTSHNTSFVSSLYSKWVKLFFALAFCAIFFSSCEDESEELTSEQIEEQRINNEKQTLQGNWSFASSEITTSLTVDSIDYRSIKSTLGAIGNINGSTLMLTNDGSYTFTNQITGGTSYTITGNWDLSKNDETNDDFIVLENLYQQLFERLDVDRTFFNDTFAENFNNFRIITKTTNSITFVNNAILVEQETVDAEPVDILVEGTYTIERQ